MRRIFSMGQPMKAASQLKGHHKSEAEKSLYVRKEAELRGDNERLKEGIRGLNDVEVKRLINKGAKDLYDLLAKEASQSSALGNNHIHDLIDLANEYENLKKYNSAIRKYDVVVFDGTKFSPNPADKMRKDSLKAIDAIKTRLGMRAVDIVTLARQKAEIGETNDLNSLFSNDKANDIWEC